MASQQREHTRQLAQLLAECKASHELARGNSAQLDQARELFGALRSSMDAERDALRTQALESMAKSSNGSSDVALARLEGHVATADDTRRIEEAIAALDKQLVRVAAAVARVQVSEPTTASQAMRPSTRPTSVSALGRSYQVLGATAGPAYPPTTIPTVDRTADPVAPQPRPPQPTTPPPLPPSSPPTKVRVTFRFPPDERLGSAAHLYWLSHANSTEHLYSELRAGMQVDETTFVGECWRVRDASSGNHLLTRYCATNELKQVVDIAPADDVIVEFHLPKAATDASSLQVAPSAEAVFVFGEIDEAAPPTDPRPDGALPRLLRPPSLSSAPSRNLPRRVRYGVLGGGGHLSVRAKPGSRFVFVESRSGRELGAITASGEARQFVTVGGEALGRVSLEFISPREAAGALSIFRRVKGDEEHLVHARLAPSHTVRLTGITGDEWIVRTRDSDRAILSLVATSAPLQRVFVEAARCLGEACWHGWKEAPSHAAAW